MAFPNMGARLAAALLAAASVACAATDTERDVALDGAAPLVSASADGGLFQPLGPDAGTTSPAVPLPTPMRAENCRPGTYSGKFDCDVNGLPLWGGVMTFGLVEASEGAGEFRQLNIVPGTRLMGMDNNFGSFDGELLGNFDCDTGVLTGAIKDGVYTSWAGAPINMTGSLKGVYQESPAPRFEGDMGPLTTPDWGPLSPTAVCKWNAMRADSATADAGAADASVPDAGAPDASVPDASSPKDASP